MKRPICRVAPLLLSAVLLVSGYAADQLPEPGQPMILLLSPSVSSSDRKDLWSFVRDLCMKRLQPGDRLVIYDGSNLKVVTDFTMPAQAKNDKLKVKYCSPLLVQLQQFLKPADDSQPVKVPQFLSNLMQRFQDASPRILVMGSPLFTDSNKKYDMSKGWLSDGFFNASPTESLFSVSGKRSYLNGAKIYYCYTSDEFFDPTNDKEIHKDKTQNFWAKYVNGMGGKLVAFLPNLRDVFPLWEKNADASLKHDPIDPSEKRMQILMPPAPRTTTAFQSGPVVLASDVLFASGSAELRSDADPFLSELAASMQVDPSLSFRIDGYTDSHGGEAYNQKLSLRRAEAVKGWLVSQGGIESTRLRTVGLGESNPKVDPGTPEQEAPNRRVEITATR